MNYARAVKGPCRDNVILDGIQEQAELEIQRRLTVVELTDMSKKYSLQQIFHNIQKVFL